MRNLLLSLSYLGTAYHGWQVQPNGVTVQEELQDALEKILGERVSVTGCSRTDSGVHAEMFCCNIRTEHKIPCEKLPAALNAHLPDDISVYDCREMREDFHARYDCAGKEYCYRIWNSRFRNPFWQGRALHYPYPLDIDKMNKAAGAFIGAHDFAGFCSAGSSVKSTVRTVTKAEVSRYGDLVTFRVAADGFLYNMVRIMAGTLLSVSQGKIDALELPGIIESKSRDRAGFTAAPQGLYLHKVYYNEEGCPHEK